jgi:hypothetical protein
MMQHRWPLGGGKQRPAECVDKNVILGKNEPWGYGAPAVENRRLRNGD